MVVSNSGLKSYHWTELNTVYDYDLDLINKINKNNSLISEKSGKMYCLLNVLRSYKESLFNLYKYNYNADTHIEIYDLKSLSCENMKVFDTMPLKLRLNTIKLIENMDEKTYSNIEDDLILSINLSSH